MASLKEYQCKICKKMLSTAHTLQVHQKIHEEARVRQFPCRLSGCDKSFYTEQSRVQHENRHNTEKKHQCSACGNLFKTSYYLRNHYEIVHLEQRPFQCEFCDKSFARKTELVNHTRIHTGERPFQCEECNKTFTQQSNLQTHIRTTHRDEKRHKCPECHSGFKRRRLLIYHIYSKHRNEKPLQCMFCDKTFIYDQMLKKHMLKCKFFPKDNYFTWKVSEDKSYLVHRVGLKFEMVNLDGFVDTADTNLEQQNSAAAQSDYHEANKIIPDFYQGSTVPFQKSNNIQEIPDKDIYEVSFKSESGCWYTIDCVAENISDFNMTFDPNIANSLRSNLISLQELCKTVPMGD